MIQIRWMTMDDLEQVSEIEQNTFSMPWSKKGLEDSLKKKGSIYIVACDGDVIVGYCGLWNILNEGNINNVAVTRNYRGKHIAFDMLKKLIELGRREKIEAFTLEVRTSNEPAIKLYQKLGFSVEGIRKNYYDSPKEDALIMWYRP
jgi:[ribosomal protein S18]-alanine N-acetyltransferase